MSGLPMQCFRRLAFGARASATAAVGPVRTAVRALSSATSASSSSSFSALSSASSSPSPSPPQSPEPTSSSRQTRHKPGRAPKGHGEQIWVYNHVVTNQVVYSHAPVLKSTRALKQLPFNGKKTKPAKLRKDYWKPLALIQFNKGSGVIGQTVFQKLREFRRLHELSWGHQASQLYALDRRERGAALNDQRANCIADIAAVLAGAGAGNKMRKKVRAPWISWTGGKTAEDKALHRQRVQEAEAEAAAAAAASPPKLAPATVFWANEYDRNIAESWSENVVHAAGIPIR
ncbi:hypothetical protein SPI_06552 [Niveomyces insectorum RCEF 264]|uniref:Large ribosomal subunit protein mL67 n=1 Tax=Niveomyces insectorum RCEF 264 TaxID=1081102 RepID=A0A167RD40_9HYPO|nr:hypothetical protein SPI_06552 [Niveomyces insectorum RCEF 264]